MKISKPFKSILLVIALNYGTITITNGMQNNSLKTSSLDKVSKLTLFLYGQDVVWSSTKESESFLIGLFFMIKSNILIMVNSEDGLPESIKKEKYITYKDCRFYKSKYILTPDLKTWENLQKSIARYIGSV